MNKKAFEFRTIFIGLVLFMVIVGIWAVVASGAARDTLVRWGIIVPDLNHTTNLSQESEIIRYNITNNKVEWFDNTHFWEFDKNGEASFNDKVLKEAQIKEDLTENYYYNSALRDRNKWITLGPRENVLIYDAKDQKEFIKASSKTPPQLDLFLTGIQYPSGDIDSFLRSKNREDRKYYGEIILKGDNLELIKLNYNFEGLNENSKKNIEKSSELYKLIVPQLNNWRFSILSKPVQLHYKEDNVDTSNYFCVAFYNPNYLRIDLSKPVSAEQICPIVAI